VIFTVFLAFLILVPTADPFTTFNLMSYHLYAREYGGHIEWVYCYDTKREAEYARRYHQETYPDFAGFPVSYFVSMEAPEPLILCDQWEAAVL